MKKGEIEVNGLYKAKVSGNLVTVRVVRIRTDHTGRTVYDVDNLSTGRTAVFRSAQKFRRPANRRGTAHRQSLADKLSENQAKDREPAAPHLIVEARAGTGKTTTLVEGLKRVKGLSTSIEPSPQQAAVWEQMELSKDARSVCFVAFNKSIATELQERVPEGCEAMTMHSMGFRAVRKAFSQVKVNSYRVQDIISELLERDIRELRKWRPQLLKATEKLVKLCKMNLVGTFYTGSQTSERIGLREQLSDLAAYYDVDMNGGDREVFALVPRVLERCQDVARDGCVDFDDMIWLPVVLGLPVFRYDLLLVDEAQDLNRCQQQLAKRAGRRLVLCGDSSQAIYGFAGADCSSMSRLRQELEATDQGCTHLPLTVTRRCGRAIVEEARRYVPEFEAHEGNGDGRISRAAYKIDEQIEDGNPQLGDYTELTGDGDMILCRVNAPLVSQCFRFLRMGRKANIQGRDVGQGLISTVKKLMKRYTPASQPITDTGAPTEEPDLGEIPYLLERLSDWLYQEQRRENAKRNPSEARLIALQDRHDCIVAFTEGQTTVEGVLKRIESVFTDDRESPGIKLSSVHKAKGLEARRVFLLQPEGASIPHPMARTLWQQEQEYNLLYVAITRAIEELVYVS